MGEPKLYIKENGRYKEYKEEEPSFDNRLYRKVGRKYEPCSMLMTDDLQEGVWVVVKHSGRKSFSNAKYLYERYMCLKASDIQDVSLAELGGLERLTHTLSRHWDELPRDTSQYGLCQAIIGLLYKYSKEK